MISGRVKFRTQMSELGGVLGGKHSIKAIKGQNKNVEDKKGSKNVPTLCTKVRFETFLCDFCYDKHARNLESLKKHIPYFIKILSGNQ